jgi:leucyl aminopeptidase (aminopeptidase T)
VTLCEQMLRIKRGVQASFNTEANYLASKAAAARAGGTTAAASQNDMASASIEAANPMAALDQAKGTAFVPYVVQVLLLRVRWIRYSARLTDRRARVQCKREASAEGRGDSGGGSARGGGGCQPGGDPD